MSRKIPRRLPTRRKLGLVDDLTFLGRIFFAPEKETRVADSEETGHYQDEKANGKQLEVLVDGPLDRRPEEIHRYPNGEKRVRADDRGQKKAREVNLRDSGRYDNT